MTTLQEINEKLPDPEMHPGRDIVVYDGDCVMCATSAARLLWWDCQNRLAYLSLHDPRVQKKWPDLTVERLQKEMCLVDRQENRHWGPEVLRYLTWRLRRLWWLMPLSYFPGSMFLWRPLYRLLAKNRFRLSRTFCEGGSCRRE